MARLLVGSLPPLAARSRHLRTHFQETEINKDSRKYRRLVLDRQNKRQYGLFFNLKGYFSLFARMVFGRELAPALLAVSSFGVLLLVAVLFIPISASAVGSGALGSSGFSSQNFTVASGDYGSDFAKKDAEKATIAKLGSATRFNLQNGVAITDLSAYSNDIDSEVQWPFPVGVPITSYYGKREAPAYGASTYHGGLDLTPGFGTPVGSIASGRVNYINYGDGPMGVYVEVEHVLSGVRVTSVYGHLGRGTVSVKLGQEVGVGDELAKVGNTGISTGPHLHFEVRINGDAVDPVYFYKKIRGHDMHISKPADTQPPALSSGGGKLSIADSRAVVDWFVAKLSSGEAQ